MAFNSGPTKSFPVKVVTMDADLEFQIEMNAMGRDLFDLVCRTIGLREIWYFGLQYTSSKGYLQWLQMGKKILKQGVDKTGGTVFQFVVKFYPEHVEEELIQETTRHLFFLQVSQAINSQDVYCPAEASILLASFAVQARLGDWGPDGESLSPSELLPSAVINQYQLTPEMWEERIRRWWINNKGLSREEAELEYLKIAQDLDQNGVHFFPVENKKESRLWLGVCASGINIYKEDNRLLPELRFQWKEIINISFRNRKLVIKVSDEARDGKSTSWVAWTEHMAVCGVILDLCVGSHNLYLSRRKADSVEIQQMKLQAREARERAAVEKARLEAERRHREELEEELELRRAQVEELEARVEAAGELLVRTEGTAELLAEKARLSDEEVRALTKRAAQAEAHIQRIQISALKTEEEKAAMEKKAREAEVLAQRLLDDSGRSAAVFPRRQDWAEPPPDPRDIRSLSAQIERERMEYAEKSRHLQSQLSELRTEIEELKVDDGDGPLDRLYAAAQRHGDDRFESLRKSSAGTAKARIQAFDGL